MDVGEGSSRKKKAASSNRKRPRKPAVSDSDEELSSENESDMDFDPEEAVIAPKRGKVPSHKRTEAQNEDSGDEAVAFTEADLVEDDADAARLAAMTELEREFELAERAERRQQEAQRRKLLEQAGGGVDEVSSPLSTGAGPSVAGTRSRREALTGDQSGRTMRSGREEREEAAKKNAMQELVAARRARTEGRVPAMDDTSDREEQRSDSYSRRRRASSEEDEALSDLEEAGGLSGWKGRQEEDDDDEAAYEDVRGIIVPRHKLEKWVGEPFFATTLPGCMVRVSLGPRMHPDGIERPQYMLAQVVDVEERGPGVYKDSGQPWRNPYPFGPNQEKTSLWLRVSRGFSERGMPLALVSNSGVSESEFEAWQRACRVDRRPQIGRAEVAEVAERLHKAEIYTYTAADVAAVLERKRAAGGGVRNVASERVRLERQRDAAGEAGDLAKKEQLERAIDALEAAAVARRGPEDGMEDINRKNRTINFQNALNNVSNAVVDPAGGHGKKEAGSVLDPFSRRATRPQNYWSTRAEEPAAAGTSGEGDAARTGPDSAAAAASVPAASTAGAASMQHVVDLSDLDFSLLDRPPALNPVARRLLGATVARQVIAGNAALAAQAGVRPLEEYAR